MRTSKLDEDLYDGFVGLHVLSDGRAWAACRAGDCQGLERARSDLCESRDRAVRWVKAHVRYNHWNWGRLPGSEE